MAEWNWPIIADWLDEWAEQTWEEDVYRWADERGLFSAWNIRRTYEGVAQSALMSDVQPPRDYGPMFAFPIRGPDDPPDTDAIDLFNHWCTMLAAPHRVDLPEDGSPFSPDELARLADFEDAVKACISGSYDAVPEGLTMFPLPTGETVYLDPEDHEDLLIFLAEHLEEEVTGKQALDYREAFVKRVDLLLTELAIVHLRHVGLSWREIAEELDVHPPRVNEAVNGTDWGEHESLDASIKAKVRRGERTCLRCLETGALEELNIRYRRRPGCRDCLRDLSYL